MTLVARETPVKPATLARLTTVPLDAPDTAAAL
jgi:hypothetical protein